MTQKICINKCHGGFDLSDVAIEKYAELKGLSLFVERKNSLLATYWLVPENERTGILCGEDFHAANLKDRKASNKRHEELTLTPREIPRDDETLVTVVLEFGVAASGRFGKIEVIEIPDGIEWQIEEYDGLEWVAEKHETWG